MSRTLPALLTAAVAIFACGDPVGIDVATSAAGGFRGDASGGASTVPGTGASGAGPLSIEQLCAATPGCVPVTLATSGCDFSAEIGDAPGFLTREQLDAMVANDISDHDIDTTDSPVCGTRIASDYLAARLYERCTASPTYDFESNPTRCCNLQSLCTKHTDCTAALFGRCRGTARGLCDYPNIVREPCASDRDCVSFPNGGCNQSPVAFDAMCEATGECAWALHYCVYPFRYDCASDADCASAPGGTCRKIATYQQCLYDACTKNEDCSTSQRCACSGGSGLFKCVPAECFEDADCGDGQTCRLETGCYGFVRAYYCSTPEDTCQDNSDCDTSSFCLSNSGRWQCITTHCPLLP